MALELVGVRVLWLMGTGILDEDGVLDLYELVGTGMLDEEGVRDLAPPLASEAGVPGVVSSARATSSESSASSRRTSSSTLTPLIEVSASMEAAVPIYLGIIDLIITKVQMVKKKNS